MIDQASTDDFVRNRCVAVDKSQPRTPKPPQKERPVSSLSMLLARTVREPMSKVDTPVLVAQANKFSCQNLLDAVSKFHESDNNAKAQLSQSLSLDTLKLYAAEDDGTPDFELPEFEKGTNIMSVGVSEFAVVDRNSQVIHVRLSSDSMQSFVREFSVDEDKRPDSIVAFSEFVEGPDALSHDEEYDFNVAEIEYESQPDPNQVYSELRQQSGNDSPDFLNVRVGTWVRGSPVNNPSANGDVGGKSTDGSQSILNTNRGIIDQQHQHRRQFANHTPIRSPLHNQMTETNLRSRQQQQDQHANKRVHTANDMGQNQVYISCRVSGSSRWSVAGRISMDSRGSDMDMELLSPISTDALLEDTADSRSTIMRTKASEYPSFVGMSVDDRQSFDDSRPHSVFTSVAMSAAAAGLGDSLTFERSIAQPRRILVSCGESDDDDCELLDMNQEQENKRKVNHHSHNKSSSSTRKSSSHSRSIEQACMIKSPKKYPLTLARSLDSEVSPSSLASSPSVGFFGEMSPSTSCSSPSTLVRNIDTGELFDARKASSNGIGFHIDRRVVIPSSMNDDLNVVCATASTAAFKQEGSALTSALLKAGTISSEVNQQQNREDTMSPKVVDWERNESILVPNVIGNARELVGASVEVTVVTASMLFGTKK